MQRHSLVIILALAGIVGPLHASVIGSATVTESQTGPSTFHYDLVLDNTGTTTIGTFWFAWVPGANFMSVAPTNLSSPALWNATVTHGAPTDGFAIQWVTISTGADLAAGQLLSGFSFNSTATPAQMAGFAINHPTIPVETTFVYSGAPFSDAGFQFVASNAAVPEPSSLVLMVTGAGLLLTGRRAKGQARS
jgi:hypothetical protein